MSQKNARLMPPSRERTCFRQSAFMAAVRFSCSARHGWAALPRCEKSPAGIGAARGGGEVPWMTPVSRRPQILLGDAAAIQGQDPRIRAQRFAQIRRGDPIYRRVVQGCAIRSGCRFSPPAIRGFDGSTCSRSSRFRTSERATTKASFRLPASRSATLKKASPK